MPDNCQAEAETARCPRGPRLSLLKPLKQTRQELGGNTLTGIADRNLDVRIHPLESDLNPPALRRELYGVREEIPHHLLQACRVAGHRASFGVENDLQPDLFGIRCRSCNLDRLFYHRGEVDRPYF